MFSCNRKRIPAVIQQKISPYKCGILNRWKEYFQGLFSSEIDMNGNEEAGHIETLIDNTQEVKPPSINEIQDIIRKQKAPGRELFKQGSKTLIELLLRKELSQEWCTHI